MLNLPTQNDAWRRFFVGSATDVEIEIDAIVGRRARVERRGAVLHDAAGAQVHAAAEALLVQRAAGDRRQCHQHRGPGQAVGATVDAAEYHQGYASQAERQAAFQEEEDAVVVAP